MKHLIIILSLFLFSSTFISCKSSDDGSKSTDNTTTSPWTTKQLGTTSRDIGIGVTTNIYVTGYTLGELDGNTNSGGRDIFLVKYNSSGIKQ